MGLVIISALYFFLPSYIANAVPVLLAKFELFNFANIRVDLGYNYKGEPLFGTTKTYRGILGGIIGALSVVGLQSLLFNIGFFNSISLLDYSMPSVLMLGFLMGLGEGAGDLLKSFVKRRFHLKSTAPSIPLDQSSFLLSLALCFLYVVPPWEVIVAILIMSPLIPIVTNIIAYKFGWKKVWW